MVSRCDLRDEQDRVAVASAAPRVRERRGAAAADAVGDHELGAEHARRVDHHHPRGDVGAAAGARVGHHLDRLRGEFVLPAGAEMIRQRRAAACETDQTFCDSNSLMLSFPPRRPV